jgi:hypothetical protein
MQPVALIYQPVRKRTGISMKKNNRIHYEPQSIQTLVASSAPASELCCAAPCFPGDGIPTQITIRPLVKDDSWTLKLREKLVDGYYFLLDILLPSRWEENNFDTHADPRPPVMITTAGDPRFAFDGRHRQPHSSNQGH